MNILFVCRGNVGRSQMGAAFFNQLSKKHHAESAGTKVNEKEGQKIGELTGTGEVIVECMKEEGIDISENTRKQLNDKMIDDADKIVVLAEPEAVPENLHKNPKAVFWNVSDPLNTPLGKHREIRDLIKKLVRDLVKDLDSESE